MWTGLKSWCNRSCSRSVLPHMTYIPEKLQNENVSKWNISYLNLPVNSITLKWLAAYRIGHIVMLCIISLICTFFSLTVKEHQRSFLHTPGVGNISRYLKSNWHLNIKMWHQYQSIFLNKPVQQATLQLQLPLSQVQIQVYKNKPIQALPIIAAE